MQATKDGFEINGYTINTSFERFFLREGVVINPDVDNLDDPQFIEALKIAVRNYKALRDYMLLLDESITFTSESDAVEYLKVLDLEALTHMQERCQNIKANTWIEIDPSVECYMQAINYLVDKMSRAKRKRKPDEPIGYVYLLNEINGPHYKIGCTSNPKNRSQTFKVALPYQVGFEVLIPTDNMYALESDLHQRFANKRVNGEWFQLSPDDVQYIKNLAETKS